MPLSERWTVSGFADVGGFDGSSDLSWEVYGGANYAFAERWAGTIGYRYMSILYEATTGEARHRHSGARAGHHLQVLIGRPAHAGLRPSGYHDDVQCEQRQRQHWVL